MSSVSFWNDKEGGKAEAISGCNTHRVISIDLLPIADGGVDMAKSVLLGKTLTRSKQSCRWFADWALKNWCTNVSSNELGTVVSDKVSSWKLGFLTKVAKARAIPALCASGWSELKQLHLLTVTTSKLF